jgi:ethanolamine utilization microcompartment shell protein EutS
VIYRTEAFFWPARIIYNSFVIGVLIAAAQVCAFAAGSVTLTWIPSTDANVVGYNVYYGGTSGDYTNKISTANTTNTVVSGLTQGVTYYFVVTAYDSSGLESPFSNEASYAIPLNAANNAATTNNVVTGNTAPTLNVIGNLVIDENAGEQTVDLSGITSGVVSGKQTIKITAATSKSDLIQKPKISYTSVNSAGILTFTPKKNAIGTATITVAVNNGEKDNNTVTQTFTVTVIDLNQPPTLNPISSFFLTENAGEQTVDLSGITSGVVSGKQTAKITATTSKSDLIPKPKISYTSVNSAGILTFTPKKNAIGTATITVTVNNGEKDNNTIIRTFAVTILAKGSATPTPATLTPATCAKGQFALTVSGLSGQKYVVEASTNLVNWVPVWTNTAPCTYIDVNAGQFSQRFYRSVPAP